MDRGVACTSEVCHRRVAFEDRTSQPQTEVRPGGCSAGFRQESRGVRPGHEWSWGLYWPRVDGEESSQCGSGQGGGFGRGDLVAAQFVRGGRARAHDEPFLRGADAP